MQTQRAGEKNKPRGAKVGTRENEWEGRNGHEATWITEEATTPPHLSAGPEGREPTQSRAAGLESRKARQNRIQRGELHEKWTLWVYKRNLQEQLRGPRRNGTEKSPGHGGGGGCLLLRRGNGP